MTEGDPPPPTPMTGWRRFVMPIQVHEGSGNLLARSTAQTLVGTAVQGVSRFFTSASVGRLQGPASLGIFASANALSQILALLWPSTSGSAASRFVASARAQGNRELVDGYASHLARRTLQSGGLLGVAAALIWVLWDRQSIASGLVVGALVIGLSGYSFTRGLQYGSGHVTRATVWDVAASVSSLLGVIVCLIAGVRGVTLLLPVATAYVTFTLINWPWHSHARLEAALARECDRYIILGVIGSIGSAGFLQGSMIISRFAGTTEDAGFYAAALALATPLSMVSVALGSAMLPSLGAAWGRADPAAAHRVTDTATRSLSLMMVGAFGAVSLSAPIITRIIWGETFTPAAELLPILVLGTLSSTLAVPSVNSLFTRSTSGQWNATRKCLIGAAIGALSWLVFVPHLGVAGVAWGYLFGLVIFSWWTMFTVARLDGLRWRSLALRLGLAHAVLLAFAIHPLPSDRLWLGPVASVTFLLGWLAVMRGVASFPRSLLPGRLKGTPR